ncbi:MAG: type 4a pilus biogenesis protein PilO, partial [bacterium]|nr:type 4a pilus biogenesis protein PilO [bacterium]
EREALQKFTDALLTTLSRQRATKQPSKGSSDAQRLKGEARAIVEEISPFLEKMTTPQFLQGVLVRSMSHIPPKNENGFLKTSFFMEAHGSFRNVTSYLERIAALPVLVSIDNVSLKTTDAKTAQVDVEISGSFFQMEAKVEKK